MTWLARHADRSDELLGLVGLGGLTTALLVAHANPATGYELSIYASTPLPVWIGIGIAFLAGVVIAFSTTDALYRRFGIALGGAGSLAVVSLPLVRGYFYYGVNDGMTHAGIVRELTTGALTPYGTAYPAIHTIAAFLSGITGFSVWQATLLVPTIASAAFFIFLPLSVRAIVGNETALVVGAFSAFLLVPLHQFASHLFAHPSSQAVLFVPVVLYLLVGYLRSPDPESAAWNVTSLGAVVLVTVGAVILLHPMQALNVLLLLAAFWFVRIVFARLDGTAPGWDHRSLAPILIASVIAYAVWMLQSPGVVSTGGIILDSLVGYLSGSSPGAGAAIGSQSSSLQAIGSSPLVVYAKLFTVSTVFILAAGALVATLLFDRHAHATDSVDTRRLLLSLVAGLAATAPVFGMYLFGNVGRYYFRQASFMMVLVTVLGAVAITYGVIGLSKTRFGSAVRPAVVTAFLALFVLSSVVFFNSPYLHLANQHVTESRIDGYGTAFETTGDEAVISGVVQEPDRYHDALVSTDTEARLSGTLNDSELRDLQAQPGADWYLILSQNTYEREVITYREYRFSRSDFQSLERQPGVSQVFANGETDLYYVP